MPSVRIRRNRSHYSSLEDGVSSGQPSRRQTTSSSQGAVHGHDPSTDSLFPRSSSPLEQSPEHPRFTSIVYQAVRHNSLNYRSRTSVPLSEQGAPHSRSRSYTTGVRPAVRDLLNASQADISTPIPPSITRRGVRSDGENQRIQLLDGTDADSAEETDDLLHDDVVVDHLDVVDPQVATVGVLTNTANAIVFPPVSVYSRRPVVDLPASNTAGVRSPSASVFEDNEIDAHVDKLLTKRAKFKRILRGVWAFLKTPMGVLVGIYGFLVVFWGTAIVLFLLKWINLHNSDAQGQWVELSCQIENTLFCITGLGLAPWRVLDTFRIAKIWWYKRRTSVLRRKAGLPALFDDDDLPDPQYDPHYVHVLSEKQQVDLQYQQMKFMESQTWYRPHGTATHRAFPIDYALAICSLNVGNSVFQAMLAGCMWSMDRFTRPAWTTGSLIPFAFLCGIFSGVLIWRGGQLTKRTAHVEECLRAALAKRTAVTAEAKERSPLAVPTLEEAAGIEESHARADA